MKCSLKKIDLDVNSGPESGGQWKSICTWYDVSRTELLKCPGELVEASGAEQSLAGRTGPCRDWPVTTIYIPSLGFVPKCFGTSLAFPFPVRKHHNLIPRGLSCAHRWARALTLCSRRSEAILPSSVLLQVPFSSFQQRIRKPHRSDLNRPNAHTSLRRVLHSFL